MKNIETSQRDQAGIIERLAAEVKSLRTILKSLTKLSLEEWNFPQIEALAKVTAEFATEAQRIKREGK